MKYIACLEIAGSDDELYSFPWLGLIKIKARELGANAFYILRHSRRETGADLVVKLFFAGEPVLKTNASKRIMNTVFVFNQSHHAEDTAHFYFNNKKTFFDPLKHYRTTLSDRGKCLIAINTDAVTGRQIVFKKIKPARFFILPDNKKTIVLSHYRIVSSKAGIIVPLTLNRFSELKYDAGRFLAEIYK